MPRTDVFVAREDIAVAIDEGDVDGIGHKTRMDRRAAWKRHDERQAVGGNRTRPSMPRRRTTNDSATANSAGVQPSLLMPARRRCRTRPRSHDHPRTPWIDRHRTLVRQRCRRPQRNASDAERSRPRLIVHGAGVGPKRTG